MIDTESWDWTEATEAKCWQGHALDLEEAADKYDEEQAFKAARMAEAEAESYADFMRDGC